MSKKPKKCISVKEARKLEKNYVETIEKTLKKELGCEECREFWWSLEEIEEYIDYVKSEAKEKGYKNQGLRFYLGHYGKNKSKDNEHTTKYKAPTGVHAKEGLAFIKGNTVGAMKAEADDNIYDIDAYNGAYGGVPPKKY